MGFSHTTSVRTFQKTSTPSPSTLPCHLSVTETIMESLMMALSAVLQAGW